MVEFFGSFKLAKSYNRIEHHTKEFKKVGEKLLTDEKRLESVSSLAQMWLRILTVSLLCIYVYIAIALFQLSIERLLVLIVVVNRLYGLFSNCQNYWQSLLQEIPSFITYKQATFDLLQHQESPQNNMNATIQFDSELRLQNVSFQYQDDGDKQTLSNVSITFPARKTTAVIGESGSGKSTLADIVIGLLIPNSGNIYLDEEKLTASLIDNWRESIAYLPQEVYLFDGTIRSNMQWIRDEKVTDKEIWSALDKASATTFIKNLPHKSDTKVGERGTQLSGGERQRIALARALLKKPNLLILDEATSSLDKKNENHIIDTLKKLRGRMTIIIITHRNSIFKHADFVVRLEAGKIVGRNPN